MASGAWIGDRRWVLAFRSPRNPSQVRNLPGSLEQTSRHVAPLYPSQLGHLARLPSGPGGPTHEPPATPIQEVSCERAHLIAETKTLRRPLARERVFLLIVTAIALLAVVTHLRGCRSAPRRARGKRLTYRPTGRARSTIAAEQAPPFGELELFPGIDLVVGNSSVLLAPFQGRTVGFARLALMAVMMSVGWGWLYRPRSGRPGVGARAFPSSLRAPLLFLAPRVP